MRSMRSVSSRYPKFDLANQQIPLPQKLSLINKDMISAVIKGNLKTIEDIVDSHELKEIAHIRGKIKKILDF